jgi:hypothetical protein
MKNATDVVAIAVGGWQSRVPRLNDRSDHPIGRIPEVDHVDLRAGHHDVACREIGNAHHALNHRKRVIPQKFSSMGFPKNLQQVITIFWCAGN